MKCTSANTFSQLRISQAYLKLLSLPENVSDARFISLEQIDHYEIRIFEPAQPDTADAPLFWMELFDHDRQSSIDSCSCSAIEEAVAAFHGFVSQAGDSDRASPGLDELQD